MSRLYSLCIVTVCVFPTLLGADESTDAPPPKLAVLLIDGQNNHDWVNTTPLLKKALEYSSLFVVDIATTPTKSEDFSSFQPNFSRYDVVVSNYNGTAWPKAAREAFVKYVNSGGGFVTVHAANNAFADWPEYNEMIGVGGWNGRNEKSGPYLRMRGGKFILDHTTPGRGGRHGNYHAYPIDVRAPDHPIIQGLPARWLHAKDELYDSLRGPAKNLTVLASAFSGRGTRGSGEHEPLLMTVRYGKGRVFHTALGHSTESMSCVGFQTTLLRGCEWAATGTVTTQGTPFDFPRGRQISRRSLPEAPAADGWIQLFNGKDLSGWHQINGTARYTVEDSTIVGTTNDGSPNSFLCTTNHYGDFELTLELKVDDELNSGIQIRSNSFSDYKDYRLHGYQVEVAINGTAGFIYDEGRRGWLSKDRSDPEANAAFKKGEWNRYRIRAVGDSLNTWVNGVPVANVTDSMTAAGVIGLQVHGIGRGTGPYQVRWRNLYLKEL